MCLNVETVEAQCCCLLLRPNTVYLSSLSLLHPAEHSQSNQPHRENSIFFCPLSHFSHRCRSKIKLLPQLPWCWCWPASQSETEMPAVDHDMKQRGFVVSSLSCHVAPKSLTIHTHSANSRKCPILNNYSHFESHKDMGLLLMHKTVPTWGTCGDAALQRACVTSGSNQGPIRIGWCAFVSFLAGELRQPSQSLSSTAFLLNKDVIFIFLIDFPPSRRHI